jgi:hypothetical protein
MSAGLVIVDTNEKLDIENQSNQEHSEDYLPRTPCEMSLSQFSEPSRSGCTKEHGWFLVVEIYVDKVPGCSCNNDSLRREC